MSNTYERSSQLSPKCDSIIDASKLPLDIAATLSKKGADINAEIEANSYDAVECAYLAKPGECSKAERQARGREKRAALGEALNALHRDEIKPFIVPIIRDCARSIEVEADKLAARDAADCARFDLPPLESQLVQALRVKARQIRATADSIEAAHSYQGQPMDILRNEVGLRL